MIPQPARTAPAKPRPGTRAREKRRTARLTLNDRRAVYAKVDLREGGLCRFTRRAGWLEHHHIVKRSQLGGDTTGNVVLISKQFHDDIHAGLLRIEGDADGTLWLVDVATDRGEPYPLPRLEVGD